MKACGLLLAAAFWLLVESAFGQHPSEIERSAAKSEFYQALVAFEKLPDRRATPGAIIAAAKSAWALGLSQRAAQEFDRALRDPTLPEVQRARILLARGAIEFQEDRFQVATLFAERGIALLKESSPLKAQLWLLWAESLVRLNSYGAAEEKYQNALLDSDNAEKPDIAYLLGLCQMHLDKLEQARVNLEMVPLRHERTPSAIRLLSQIALEQKRYTQAGFWLSKGREEYPDSFLDSWVDYALIQVAINAGDEVQVRELMANAISKYPPSDSWLILLNSAAEAFLWTRARQEPAPASGQIGVS